MAGARCMTEPNVLGNVSIGKFLFESGNTEIINLWKDAFATNDHSLHEPSAGTTNGVIYVVPASRVFYLLSFGVELINGGNIDIDLMSNTTPDTATGGTTQQKFTFESASPSVLSDVNPRQILIKFVAGEYVTPIVTGGNDYMCSGWGVECDA